MRLRGWVSSHSISFWHINKPKRSVSPKFSKQEIPKRAAIWRFSGASVWVVYKQEQILVRDTADWRGLQQDQQGETPGWTNVKTSCESKVKVKQSALSPTPSSPGTACFFLQMKLLPLPLIGQTLTAVMTVRQMAPPPMTSLVSCPLSPHCHRGNRKVSNCIWPSGSVWRLLWCHPWCHVSVSQVWTAHRQHPLPPSALLHLPLWNLLLLHLPLGRPPLTDIIIITTIRAPSRSVYPPLKAKPPPRQTPPTLRRSLEMVRQSAL